MCSDNELVSLFLWLVNRIFLLFRQRIRINDERSQYDEIPPHSSFGMTTRINKKLLLLRCNLSNFNI